MERGARCRPESKMEVPTGEGCTRWRGRCRRRPTRELRLKRRPRMGKRTGGKESLPPILSGRNSPWSTPIRCHGLVCHHHRGRGVPRSGRRRILSGAVEEGVTRCDGEGRGEESDGRGVEESGVRVGGEGEARMGWLGWAACPGAGVPGWACDGGGWALPWRRRHALVLETARSCAVAS
jgi:hypothetical protein